MVFALLVASHTTVAFSADEGEAEAEPTLIMPKPDGKKIFFKVTFVFVSVQINDYNL